MPVEIECPKCGSKEAVPEEWKVFNVVVCPECFTEIALPWCREGFEPKGEPLLFMKKDDFLKIAKKKGWTKDNEDL